MFNFALGTLLGGVAIALLVQEWIKFHQWRKQGDPNLLYSPRIFYRRALVSLLILGFIALVRMQPLVLQDASARRASLYLLLYLVIIVAMFTLAAFDYRHNRKIAAILENQMAEYQAISLGLIAQMNQKGKDPNIPRGDDSVIIDSVDDNSSN